MNPRSLQHLAAEAFYGCPPSAWQGQYRIDRMREYCVPETVMVDQIRHNAVQRISERIIPTWRQKTSQCLTILMEYEHHDRERVVNCFVYLLSKLKVADFIDFVFGDQNFLPMNDVGPGILHREDFKRINRKVYLNMIKYYLLNVDEQTYINNIDLYRFQFDQLLVEEMQRGV